MCLGSIARVVEARDDGRLVVLEGGRLERGGLERGGVEGGGGEGGARREVLAMTLAGDDSVGGPGGAPAGPCRPGDWVVIQSGFALERVSEAEALEALRIRGHEIRGLDPVKAHEEVAP
nr:HypC/HybG/HupF family hydrogenase formation chaperone [Demequina pelophila]